MKRATQPALLFNKLRLHEPDGPDGDALVTPRSFHAAVVVIACIAIAAVALAMHILTLELHPVRPGGMQVRTPIRSMQLFAPSGRSVVLPRRKQ